MPLIERDITLTCVSNDVGGPYVGGARWLGVRLTDLLDRAGVGEPGRPDPQHRRRRVHDQHPARPRHRRPRRDGRGRHERRGAAPRARLPRADGRPRALRLHQRHQVAHPADADDVRRRRTRTGPSATGPPTPRSRSPAGSTPRSRSRRSTPATRSSAASPGRSTAASTRSRCRSTAARGSRPSSARRPATTTGASGTCPGRPTRASTTSPSAPPTKDGEVQTAVKASPFPEGSSGLQRIIVRVALRSAALRSPGFRGSGRGPRTSITGDPSGPPPAPNTGVRTSTEGSNVKLQKLYRTGGAAAAVLTLSLGLAACGGDDAEPTSASDETTSEAPTPRRPRWTRAPTWPTRPRRRTATGAPQVPDQRRRLVRRHGHRAGRLGRQRQPAAQDPGRRGHRGRPGRAAELRSGAHRLRARRAGVRGDPEGRTSTRCSRTRRR